MFGALRQATDQEACDKNHSEAANIEETESFLRRETAADYHHERLPWKQYTLLWWQLATLLFASLFCVSILTDLRSKIQPRHNYENGFTTDLRPATSAIKLREIQFHGGIIVNSTGQFELIRDPKGPRFTGHPTQKLDDAWDELVGGYIPLTKEEADEVGGEVSNQNGNYYVVPAVRHNLHCVNYLRKVAYNKWYPVIFEERDHIPAFWDHVDHCVETLRETIQCSSDLTPVPHVWNEAKQQYLADTMLHTIALDQEWANHQKCIDLRGHDGFRPDHETSISVIFNADSNGGVVSIVVFELQDEHLGGIRDPKTGEKQVICSAENLDRGLCDETQLGEFLISDSARRRSKNPFVTRAVNLSRPVTVHYPVSARGYYCAATYGYSSSTYHASMVVVDPTLNLPAFRAGLLVIYQWLSPVWSFVGLAYAAVSTDRTASSDYVVWLILLSVVQVLLRLVALEAGESSPLGWSSAIILWYVLEAGQDFLALYLLLDLPSRRIDSSVSDKPRSSNSGVQWMTSILLSSFLALFIASSWVDYHATANTITPMYLNVVTGLLLLLFFVIGAARVFANRQYGTMQRAGVLGVLLSISIAGLALVVFNIWAITWAARVDPAGFASRFWQMRYWGIDTPFGPLFLVLVVVSVVL